MAPTGQITEIQAVRSRYASMTEFQQKEMLNELGISDINLLDYKLAQTYCKTHNIQTALANNSAFVAESIKQNADAKYAQATAMYGDYHNQLTFANQLEGTSKYNAQIYLNKAQAYANKKGIELNKNSDDYKKYLTFDKQAKYAQSLFNSALAGEQMAVHNMAYANKLSAISLFAQKQS